MDLLESAMNSVIWRSLLWGTRVECGLVQVMRICVIWAGLWSHLGGAS